MNDISSEIRLLWPEDKMDTKRAEALVALGYPALAPVLLDLMYWMADTNWPVADVIIPFLATVGLPLVPSIREVFSTNDSPWKENVLRHLVIGSPAIFEAVQAEVRQMAFNPALDRDEEEVQETARQVLNHFGEGLRIQHNSMA